MSDTTSTASSKKIQVISEFFKLEEDCSKMAEILSKTLKYLINASNYYPSKIQLPLLDEADKKLTNIKNGAIWDKASALVSNASSEKQIDEIFNKMNEAYAEQINPYKSRISGMIWLTANYAKLSGAIKELSSQSARLEQSSENKNTISIENCLRNPTKYLITVSVQRLCHLKLHLDRMIKEHASETVLKNLSETYQKSAALSNQVTSKVDAYGTHHLEQSFYNAVDDVIGTPGSDIVFQNVYKLLEDITQQKNDLANQLHEEKLSSARQNKVVTRLQATMVEQNQTISDLAQQLREAKTRYASMEVDLQLTKNRLLKSQEAEKSIGDQIIKEHQSQETMDRRIKDLEEQVNAFQKLMREYQEETAADKKNIANLTQDVDSKNERIIDLENEITALKVHQLRTQEENTRKNTQAKQEMASVQRKLQNATRREATAQKNLKKALDENDGLYSALIESVTLEVDKYLKHLLKQAQKHYKKDNLLVNNQLTEKANNPDYEKVRQKYNLLADQRALLLGASESSTGQGEKSARERIMDFRKFLENKDNVQILKKHRSGSGVASRGLYFIKFCANVLFLPFYGVRQSVQGRSSFFFNNSTGKEFVKKALTDSENITIKIK